MRLFQALLPGAQVLAENVKSLEQKDIKGMISVNKD